MSGHIPVMLNEVVECLSPKDGEVYVDGTFGAGGSNSRGRGGWEKMRSKRSENIGTKGMYENVFVTTQQQQQCVCISEKIDTGP